MSTGGNVPTQGVTPEAAPPPKKRGSRCEGHPEGYVGKGSSGSRLRTLWHRRPLVASSVQPSFRQFVRQLAAVKSPDKEAILLQVEDAKLWLLTKRHGGTDENRKFRKERRKERRSINLAAKIARKSKGKQKKKAPETSRSA